MRSLKGNTVVVAPISALLSPSATQFENPGKKKATNPMFATVPMPVAEMPLTPGP